MLEFPRQFCRKLDSRTLGNIYQITPLSVYCTWLNVCAFSSDFKGLRFASKGKHSVVVFPFRMKNTEFVSQTTMAH